MVHSFLCGPWHLKSGGNIYHRMSLNTNSLERRNGGSAGKCFMALLLAFIDVETTRSPVITKPNVALPRLQSSPTIVILVIGVHKHICTRLPKKKVQRFYPLRNTKTLPCPRKGKKLHAYSHQQTLATTSFAT